MTRSGVIPLLDGSFEMEVALFPEMISQPVEAARLMGLSALPARITVPVWAFLVRTSEGPVLVDAGGGTAMGAGFGATIARMAEAGFRPPDICRIYLTHLHGDHCAGLLNPDGAVVFEHARISVSGVEVAFWTSDAVPKGMAAVKRDAERVLSAYSGLIDLVSPGQRIGDALAINAAGHTPGHIAWDFARQGAIAVGDILHHADVQLACPGWGCVWDMNRSKAIASRRSLISVARRRGADLLCAHGGRIKTEKVADDA